MEDICSKNYAKFMENILTHMVKAPVEGICVVTKLKGGAIMADYFNSSMMDKLIYAGVVQQNAMMEVLQANNMLKDEEEEEDCA